MGGIPRIYVRPVPAYGNKWLSSFWAHQHRDKPSKEPGVDYYCPLGTTLVSIGDGYVAEIGGSIYAATGRYVKVNLDNGQSFRLLHLGPRHSLKKVGDRVKRGEPLAISGASGYGSEYFGAATAASIPANTGGPHTHATLFPTWDYNNFRGLLDLEEWVDPSDFQQSTSNGDEDMAFAMQAIDSPDGRERAIVELAPGFRPNALSQVEFDNYYGGRPIKCSAAQYDINLARHLRLTPASADTFLGRGQSERPWTLFAPGYVFQYVGGIADELLANQPFAVVRLEGNDRQYDLWTVQALRGTLPAVAVDLPDVLDIDADISDDDLARVATAVREKFRTDPLK